MAARLQQIFSDHDWHSDPSKPTIRANFYRKALEGSLSLATEVQTRFDLAHSLLLAGDSDQAVEELLKLQDIQHRLGIVLRPKFERDVQELLALSYLRMGEQQNCLTNHNAQSCVFPIRGEGIHKDRRGAQAAAAVWTALLEKNPESLIDRWMLNIAWMTLGGPPADAPKEWIIPESTFKSDDDIGMFTDVAVASGLDINGLAGGSVAEDMDGDGYFDLVVSSSGPRDQLRYFHNNADGTFTDQTHAAGLDGETGGLNLVHADYNNDGWPDILILRGGWWGKNGNYPVSLLRNNGPNATGQITFTDVTEEAGLLSAHPTQTAAWADYDGDGLLDLMLGHESSSADSYPSELFHNNGDGTFTNVAVKVGLSDLGFVKGVAWGDFNNDGRPDLYISRKAAPNSLFRNDGPDAAHGWKFTEVTKSAGVAEPLESFGTWFFDFDNDGQLDLLVTGYDTGTWDDIPASYLGLPNKAETTRLYRNRGDGTFEEVAKKVGLDRVILPMGVGFGDLDNDGWLDCYFGTGAPDYLALLPNRMFRNDQGRRFLDVTTSGGFGQLQKGHAISFADFNRDGQQDVFEVLGGAIPGDRYMSTLLANPGHDGAWMGLKLEGVKSNRSAIGARVRVDFEEPGGARSIYRTVNSGTSFGDSPFELHLGLGKARAIKQVEIRWPSGLRQVVTGLELGRIYRLSEGDTRAQVVTLKPFPYLQTGGAHQHAMR